MTHRKQWLVVFVKLCITLTLLLVLLLRTPVDDMLERMRSVGALNLLAATAILFSLFLLTALRWQIVLKGFGKSVRIGELWRYTLIGAFFNQVLLSGMGGDVLRAWYARYSDVPTGKAAASVIVDRLLGLMAVVLVVIAGTPFFLPASVPEAALAAFAAMAASLALGLFVLIALEMQQDKVLAIARKSGQYDKRVLLMRALEEMLRAVRDTRRMFLTWPDGPAALALSLATQLAIGYVVYLLIVSLGGRIALTTATVLFPLVLLLSMLPISIAGWGVREGVMVVAFGLADVPSGVSLSASILYGACQLTASLPGVVVWLLLRRAAPTPLS